MITVYEGGNDFESMLFNLCFQLAEITRQRDDAEMLIPSLKAKIALLKKSCREKDETVTRYMEELKQFKHHMVGTKGSVVKGRVYEPVPQVRLFINAELF